MAMEQSRLEQLIRAGIPNAQIRIEDFRGDGDHYEAHITSPAFKGLSRVQQHQMVYTALQGAMNGELHALSIKTYIPEGA